MSPIKIVWLIVGSATILREDLLEKTPCILAIAKIWGRGWGPAQTDIATFQKWTILPK